MSWDHQRSATRIQQHLRSMQPINVSELTKEMDLEQVVSENQCKQLFGVHIYTTLSKFTQLASCVPLEEGYKDLIIALHLYQREVFHIVEEVFGGYFVHFQGPKVHALLSQPFRDAQVLATRAILLQLVLTDFVRTVFHPIFPRYRNAIVASGADLGRTIATSNGLKNDRELLFIGSAANLSAKILDPGEESAHLTQEIYRALPTGLQSLCRRARSVLNTAVYSLDISEKAALARLLRTYGIKWQPEKRMQNLLREKKRLSFEPITIHSQAPFKDFKELSHLNNRRVFAASLFADVSGFTRYIAEAEKKGILKEALRVLHVIREEVACVVRQDFPGLRVQFQGDRVQAIFLGAIEEEHKIARIAVQAAIGLQSSMEGPIKQCLQEAYPLHLAIGIDLGWTLLSRLGIRAYRDPICIGQPVERAAAFEEGCTGGEIAISRRLYRALPSDLQSLFERKREAQCSIARPILPTR